MLKVFCFMVVSSITLMLLFIAGTYIYGEAGVIKKHRVEVSAIKELVDKLTGLMRLLSLRVLNNYISV